MKSYPFVVFQMIMSLRRSTLFGLMISTKLEMQRVPVGKAMANSHYGYPAHGIIDKYSL